MSFPYDQLNTNTDAPLIAANYYPRFQQMLKEEDIVVVETGTFYYGMAEVRLPSDVYIYILVTTDSSRNPAPCFIMDASL